MATNFAVAYFFLPLAIAVALICLMALLAPKPVADERPVLGLGARRIAQGYLGALLGTLFYSIVDTVRVGYEKFDLGHVAAAEMPGYLPGWTIYQFVLVAPFVLIAITLLALPLLAIASRVGLVSLVTLLVSAFAWSAFWAWRAYAKPYNWWCEHNQLQCVGGAFLGAFVLATVVALGFSLGARLPVIRSRTAI
jgi:hypothetical protein